MINPTKNNPIKYLLFYSLYFSEGLMIAITTAVTTVFLREQGIPIPETTLVVGIINMPWVLKFLWGPIIDKYKKFGRKSFIISGGLLAAFSMMLVSIFDPAYSIIPFTFLIFIGHVGIGFTDLATDAWAIEISTKKDRGKINGAMYGGLYSAWAFGAAFLLYIASNYGYNMAYFVTGLLILIIITIPLFVKEIIKIKEKPQIKNLLVKEFKKTKNQLIAFYAPLVFMNEGILAFIMPIFMKDQLGLEAVQIGLITAILPIMLAIGSFIGGTITDKIGRNKTLYIFISINIIFTGSLIFVDNWMKLSIIYAIIGFIMGSYQTVSCALFMDATNPKIAATQYGIFAGVGNLGVNGGGMLTGVMVASLGFSRTFLYAGWVFGPALLILYFIRTEKNDNKKV